MNDDPTGEEEKDLRCANIRNQQSQTQPFFSKHHIPLQLTKFTNMKTTILSLLTVLASASASSEDSIFQGAPTKTTPVQMHTDYGSVVTLGQFTSLMEQGHPNRQLQGFGNDPSACTSTGVEFTCLAPSELKQGDNATRVDNTVTCTLDDAIGMMFQDSENCRCQALLTDQFNSGNAPRTCLCGVCPRGSTQAVSLDCSMNTEHPFVAGPCTSLNCAGQCNGTGATVLNQPTPAPEGGGSGEVEEGDKDGSAMMNLATGAAVGAVVSFLSVYVF